MAQDYDFVLSVGNPNSNDAATYEGEVNGFVYEHDGSLEGSDNIANEAQFTGTVRGAWDHLQVKGFVRSFSLDGGAQVQIDGQSVSASDVDDYRPDRFTNDGSDYSNDSDSDDRGHYLAIEGVNGGSSYTLEAGSVSPLQNVQGGSVNTGDNVNQAGDRAEGAVGGGVDPYEYTGVRDFNADNPENVRLHLKKSGSTRWEVISEAGDSGGSDGEDETSSLDGGNDSPSSDGDAPWKGADGHITNTRPRYGVVNRPRSTSDHRTLYVGHGDFGTGDGTRSNPFGTVQDALNMMPERIEHDYIIQLLPGVHGGEPGNSLNTNEHTVIGLNSAKVQIRGDPNNPGNYAVEAAQINVEFYGGALETEFNGVHLIGALQNYDGSVSVQNSILEAGSRWGQGAEVAFDCYGGHIVFINSTIRAHEAEAVFNLTENGEVQFGGNVTVDAGNTTLATTGIGGGRLSLHPSTNLNCGPLTEGWEPGAFTVSDTGNVSNGHNEGRHAVRLQ